MKNASTRITVISGLGVGDEKRFGEWRYAEVEYELHGEKAAKKPLIAQALVELIPRVRRDEAKVERAVFLGTPKVEEIWWKSGLVKRGLPGVEASFVLTPEGKTQGELWEIASALASILEADHDEDPDERRHYYVEVTLGYRAMPILVVSAINLALAEWSRRHRRNPPRVTMLYGAWEAKASDGSMPIWDLTDLITVGRWSSALASLGQYGRADELSAVAASLSGDWAGGADDEESGIHALADAAQAASRDLSFGRLGDLFTRSVPALLEQIDSEPTRALGQRLPPLQDAIDGLRKAVEPLQAAEVVGPEGLKATVAFARLCAALGRHADQAAALREAIVTHYGRSTRRVAMLEPGTKGFGRQRERVTAELNDLWTRASAGTEEERAAFLASLPPALREPLDHLKPLERLRADLGRLGFAEGSTSPNQLRASLDARLGKLAALLEGPLPPVAFVNLSDTPVEAWSPEQTEAARALGTGEPIDLLGGLPELDAEADDEQIERLTRDLASRAIAQGATGACVDTDPSLTFALVAELQARGIRCFAPATRKVTVEKEVDGATRKQTVAQFARWRPFARPASEDE